jgi:hypothetical protein
MGAEQPWIPLDERMIRGMLVPLGVTCIYIDPDLVRESDPLEKPPESDRARTAFQST